jgi:hypothetical protein
MKQKKNTLLFCILTLAIASEAQTGKPTFGFTAGVTFASFMIKSDNVSTSSGTKVGFSAGLLSSFHLNSHFSFQPALDFIQKGGELKNGNNSITENAAYYYLSLPLNFVYNIHSAKGVFFIGAGPSVGIGLFGHYKITGMYEESGDIKFGGGGDNDLKVFEFGANALAGFSFKKGLLIAAQYDLGLNNISSVNNASFHNRCFGLKLGYLFQK